MGICLNLSSTFRLIILNIDVKTTPEINIRNYIFFQINICIYVQDIRWQLLKYIGKEKYDIF